MKITNLIYLALLVSFLMSGIHAKEEGHFYNCVFKAKAEQKNFTYDSLKDVGKSLKLAGHDLLLWHKDSFLMMKIRGGIFVSPLSIQFALGQQTIRFNLKPNLDLTCVAQEKLKQEKLTSKSKIENFEERVVFNILKELSFRATQSEETQLMRTLFFQNGNIYINSNDMERKLPWCSLRVQLKEKRDTKIYPGEKFKPLSFQKQENNSYFTTFSYSFVDFAAGKKRGETATYSPFTFSCNILRGMAYNLDNLQSIVGEFVSVSEAPAL